MTEEEEGWPEVSERLVGKVNNCVDPLDLCVRTVRLDFRRSKNLCCQFDS